MVFRVGTFFVETSIGNENQSSSCVVRNGIYYVKLRLARGRALAPMKPEGEANAEDRCGSRHERSCGAVKAIAPFA